MAVEWKNIYLMVVLILVPATSTVTEVFAHVCMCDARLYLLTCPTAGKDRCTPVTPHAVIFLFSSKLYLVLNTRYCISDKEGAHILYAMYLYGQTDMQTHITPTSSFPLCQGINNEKLSDMSVVRLLICEK